MAARRNQTRRQRAKDTDTERKNRSNNSAATSTKSKRNKTFADCIYTHASWRNDKFLLQKDMESTNLNLLLDGSVSLPEINPHLAANLILDESRTGVTADALERIVPPSNIPTKYLHYTTREQLSELRDYLQPLALAEIKRLADKPTEEGKEAEVYTQEQLEAEAEKLLKGQMSDFKLWQERLTQHRLKYNNVDPVKHAKLIKSLCSSFHDTFGLHIYKALPAHRQFVVYKEINKSLYDLLDDYVPINTKHVKTGVPPGDGIAFYKKLDSTNTKDSPMSTQHVMKRLINARQLPGQTYEAFVDYMKDLKTLYKQAAGKDPDESLIRLALTERVTDFYKATIENITSNDLTTGVQTPIEGDVSIMTAVKFIEQTKIKEFKKYTAKQKTRRNTRSRKYEQALIAKGRNKQKTPEPIDPADRVCTWCRKYLPHLRTNHTAGDCRIKNEYANTKCHVCEQLGHPARLCPDSTGHTANTAQDKAPKADADDDESVASNTSRRSRALRRRPADQLTAAEAIKMMKSKHKHNKARGNSKHRFYRIVELSSSDEN